MSCIYRVDLLDEMEREIVLNLERLSTVGWLMHQTGRAEASVRASLEELQRGGWVENSGPWWFRTERGDWSIEDYDHAA